MHVSRVVTGLLIAATVLAGCSGKAASSSDALDQAAAGIDVKATATTGVIRGVVVDSGIRPVSGILVTTQSQGKAMATNTSVTGAFGFEGLSPGTYFLKTHKAGFADTQSSTEVVAGDAAPALVKIQVAADSSTKPSVDIFHFKGFLECSILTGPFFTPCYTPAFGPVPEERVGNDNSYTTFNITGNVTYLETDLIWAPTQAFGTEMYFNTCSDFNDYPGSCTVYTGGTSPQIANATGKNAYAFEKSGRIYFEVATNGVGDVLPANPVRQDPGGASLEQDFDAYFVICHGFSPPAGYSFFKDQTPVVPS